MPLMDLEARRSPPRTPTPASIPRIRRRKGVRTVLSSMGAVSRALQSTLVTFSSCHHFVSMPPERRSRTLHRRVKKVSHGVKEGDWLGQSVCSSGKAKKWAFNEPKGMRERKGAAALLGVKAGSEGLSQR